MADEHDSRLAGVGFSNVRRRQLLAASIKDSSPQFD
jgi:hypothetical protein